MGIYTDRGYTLEDAKANCLAELDVWYGGVVLDVFDSNVLGANHRYYCSEADQLRMLNGKVSNVSAPLMCGLIPAEGDPVYEWKLHTATEAGKVHTAYVTFSKTATDRYNSLKSSINTATTVEQLEAILDDIL